MNLLAVVLGMVSLGAAGCAFRVEKVLLCGTVSLAGCGGALLCQLWELNRLVQIADTAAIYDTVRVRCLAGTALLVLNLILHLLAMRVKRKRKCGNC